MRTIIKSNSGFTLIEMVLVLVIVGILGISVMPAMQDLDREAKIAKTKSLLASVKTTHTMAKASLLLQNGGQIPSGMLGVGTFMEGKAPINPLTDSNGVREHPMASGYPNTCFELDTFCRGVVKTIAQKGWAIYRTGSETSRVYACPDDCSKTDTLNF